MLSFFRPASRVTRELHICRIHSSGLRSLPWAWMKNGLDCSVMPEIPLRRQSFHSKSEMKLKDISRGRSPGRPAHFGTWRRRWDKPPVRVRVDQILLASSLAICLPGSK